MFKLTPKMSLMNFSTTIIKADQFLGGKREELKSVKCHMRSRDNLPVDINIDIETTWNLFETARSRHRDTVCGTFQLHRC